MNDGSLFRTHYTDYKRITFVHLRKINLGNMMDISEDNITDTFFPNELLNPYFYDKVLEEYEDVLTKEQLKYLSMFDSRVGRKRYSRQYKKMLRIRMTKKLTKHFFGQERVVYHRINEDLFILDTIKQFMEVDDNNKKFTRLLVELADNWYVNNILYGKIDAKTRLRFHYARTNEDYVIPTKYLNTIYEIMLKDKEVNYERYCEIAKYKKQRKGSSKRKIQEKD